MAHPPADKETAIQQFQFFTHIILYSFILPIKNELFFPFLILASNQHSFTRCFFTIPSKAFFLIQ